MEQPIRVLVVEDPTNSRSLANQLLEDFDLEFSWQPLATDDDLNRAARSFLPNIVLCVDERPGSSLDATLDLIRLFSSGMPAIQVCQAGGRKILPALDGPPLGADFHRRRRVASALASGENGSGVFLPSSIGAAGDLALMVDSDGLITHTNANLRRIVTSERPPVRIARPWIPADPVDDRRLTALPVHGLNLGDAWNRGRPTCLTDIIDTLFAGICDVQAALAFVGVDLEGLPLLSAECGPDVGDSILNQISSTLRRSDPHCGMIARLGRNNFLIVFPEVSSPEQAAITAWGALRSMTERCRWPAPKAMTRASSEVFAGATGGSDSAIKITIPRAAPSTDASRLHDPPPDTVNDPQDNRPRVERDLEDAIRRHGLSVQYQPQFELESGRGCGVEVLARWIRSDGKSLAPGIFIPVAERTGMIRQLGAWILECACESAIAWRGGDAERITVSINVSNLQINDEFYGDLSAVLGRFGFPPERLELEIPESAVLGNSERTIGCLKQWKRLGVRIAVNHFGIDYSCLSYLNKLDVDRLKLDKSIIQSMTREKEHAATHAVILLGAELGVDVVAEGVETEAQFNMLTELGCPKVQGYLLGRPMSDKQAQISLRKSWGNMPKSVPRPGQSQLASH